jgi:hypothetical protein
MYNKETSSTEDRIAWEQRAKGARYMSMPDEVYLGNCPVHWIDPEYTLDVVSTDIRYYSDPIKYTSEANKQEEIEQAREELLNQIEEKLKLNLDDNEDESMVIGVKACLVDLWGFRGEQDKGMFLTEKEQAEFSDAEYDTGN